MDDQTIEKILLPVTAEKNSKREEKVRTQFWPKFTKLAAQLPFAEDIAAAWFCAIDSNTPPKVRGTLLAALAYFILPLDMIPDIVAVIGFSDDIAVLSAAIALVSRNITWEHREQAREAIEKAKNQPV